MSLLIRVSSLLSLMLLLLTGPATAQSDTLIVPGVRIGPITIGMREADVYRALGEPSLVLDGDDSIEYLWKRPNVSAGCEGCMVVVMKVLVEKSDNKVFRVGTGDEKLTTADGLSLSSSELRVRSVMGSPSREEWDKETGLFHRYFYHSRGICFVFFTKSPRPGRMDWLAVFTPNSNMNHCW